MQHFSFEVRDSESLGGLLCPIRVWSMPSWLLHRQEGRENERTSKRRSGNYVQDPIIGNG